MKRRAAAVAGFLILAQAAAFAAEEKTIVYNYDGKVSVIRNRKTLLVDFDMPCREGDTLRTEPDGFIDLAMNGIAGVRVLPSSECLIVNTNPSDIHLKLAFGSLMIHLKNNPPSGGSVTIETESSKSVIEEAGQFYVEWKPAADKKPASTLSAANKGRMEVYSKKASVTVSLIEGKAIDVPLASSIPSLRNASEEEEDVLGKILSIYVSD